LSERAFDERVAAALRHVLDALPDTPRDRADARSYVDGLARVAREQARVGSDPAAPRFVENPSPTSKWGAENADNRYLWAPLDPSAAYRVHGRRGTSFEILFETKEGFMQQGAPRNFAACAASELRVEPDGRFEVLLGGPARDRGWLPLDPDARWLLVREYFADWAREEPASLAIERIGAPAREPEPASLASAGAWVEATARYWTEWVDALRAAYAPGKLAPARGYEGGADAILYGNDWFRLAEDEALLVECDVPDARYWAFQLVDPCFRSLDWAHHQTSLNHAQAKIDADGRVRVVVARRDPGVANWLDTTALAEGVFQYRFIWTKDAPQPTARLVPIDALPRDLVRVSAAERAATIAMRSRHLARRKRA
jgi:hypothetical protein